MAYFIVDKAKALKKWSPILEALKVKDEEKREWMAEYAEMHQLHINENVAYTTLNQNGMGNILAPTVGTIPGSVWQTGVGQIGSGDVAQNLLPVSMKIAAQTIGLDLVAVKPSASPRIELLFVDFKYDNAYGDGTREDQEATQRPLVFKIFGSSAVQTAAIIADLQWQLGVLQIKERIGGIAQRTWVYLGTMNKTAAQIAAGPGTGTKQYWLEFLGFSRIDGYPIFRCYRQAGFSVGPLMPQDGSAWTQANNTFDQSTAMTTTLSAGFEFISGTTVAMTTALTGYISGVTIQLISLLEDQLPGFSAGFNGMEDPWDNGYGSGDDNFGGTSLKRSGNGPMNRYQDEKTYPGIIGPDVFTKVVTVGDIEISSALKRTQIEDIKAATGMDIVQKLEGVLINELTQVISKEIVAKIRSLASKNRISHTAPKNADGTSKFDFDVDTYVGLNQAGYAPGGETTHSLQRKLVAKINNASNFIATDGRIGPAQYLVTNGNIASVLQDIAGYTLNPTNVGKLNTNGQLYPMGNIGNIQIYVDPYMRWDDNQIFVGRKNTVDQPGLLFIPYLMAQSISLISEATWAPRMLIRSRYAVSDIGFFPEKQYMCIQVTDTHGYLI